MVVMVTFLSILVAAMVVVVW